MKFGQLTEYNIINIVFEKPYAKCLDKPFPDLFMKNQNWTYLWIDDLNCYKFVSILYPSKGPSKNKLKCRPIAFILYRAL